MTQTSKRPSHPQKRNSNSVRSPPKPTQEHTQVRAHVRSKIRELTHSTARHSGSGPLGQCAPPRKHKGTMFKSNLRVRGNSEVVLITGLKKKNALNLINTILGLADSVVVLYKNIWRGLKVTTAVTQGSSSADARVFSPSATVPPIQAEATTVNKFIVTKLWQKSINKFVEGKTTLWATWGDRKRREACVREKNPSYRSWFASPPAPIIIQRVRGKKRH